MGFEKFGGIGYVSDTEVTPFLRYLMEGKIAGTRCKSCERLYFPPRAQCVRCLSSDMDWTEMNGKAILITYTTIYSAPAGFEEDVPYTLGVARLEEGPKVLARLDKNIDRSGIAIGMKLKLISKKLAESGRVTYELTKADS